MRYIVAVILLAALAYAEEKWEPSVLCPFPSDVQTRSKYQGDCSIYWECYQGARYIMTCPQGLEYNDVEHRCDAPEIAHCDKDTPVVYPVFPHDPYNPDTPGDSVDPDPGSDWSPDPLCPYPSHDLVFFPDPTDCSKYLECYEGNKFRMNCPANLYWNELSNNCDYLDNVNCDRTPSDPDTPDDPDVGPDSPDDPQDPVNPGGDWAPDPLCPYPSHDLVFFPDPTDCTKYLECYEGNKFRMNCPANLYWNELANICDYLDNVNCDRTPNNPDDPDVGPDSPDDPQDPGNPDSDIDPQCPYPSHDLVFFPDPTDCTIFYQCHEGHKFKFSCPANSYFDDVSNTCDYLENVNCDRTPSDPDTPDNPDVGPDTPDDPQDPGNPDWTPDPLCPYPSHDLVFFPDPTDCTKFLECYEGNKFIFSCPATLYFNDVTHTCDYLDNVNCDRTPNNPDTPDDPDVGPDSPDDPEIDPVTVCLTKPDGTFLANPNDCRGFYDCVRGEAVPGRCAIGLRWNQKILTCDYEANVKC